MSNIKLEDLKEGMKIRLKTKEQLKECGWEEYQNGVMYREDVDWIVSEMLPWLGKEVTVSTVYDPEFEIEEEGYNWYPCMVAEIINADNNYQEPYYGVTQERQTTAWNKESIQRTFEELQMYDKGYVDGFKRAIELMKEKFGVEL